MTGRRDAPSVWDGAIPPGGSVCGECGVPVESEPCLKHQPLAYRGDVCYFCGVGTEAPEVRVPIPATGGSVRARVCEADLPRLRFRQRFDTPRQGMIRSVSTTLKGRETR